MPSLKQLQSWKSWKRGKIGDRDVMSLKHWITKQSFLVPTNQELLSVLCLHPAAPSLLPRRTLVLHKSLEKGIYIFGIFLLILIIFIFIITILLKKEFKFNISFIALGASIPKLSLLRLEKSFEVPTSFIKPKPLVTSNQMGMDSQIVIAERYYFRNFLSLISF